MTRYKVAKESFINQLKRQIRQNKVANSITMGIGVFFIFLAVLGAFLPFIPGILFLILGIIILGEEFFLTRWIIKKSPRAVRDRLQKRNSRGGDNPPSHNRSLSDNGEEDKR